LSPGKGWPTEKEGNYNQSLKLFIFYGLRAIFLTFYEVRLPVLENVIDFEFGSFFSPPPPKERKRK